MRAQRLREIINYRMNFLDAEDEVTFLILRGEEDTLKMRVQPSGAEEDMSWSEYIRWRQGRLGTLSLPDKKEDT